MVMDVPFLRDALKLPHPLTCLNKQPKFTKSDKKVFCRCSLCHPGCIHAQEATLNINITLGGGRKFAALTLAMHVWQNDTFPNFVISFLTFS